ncbi:MAG TPA: GDP-mannose 4,6-dehydratase [Verrucomicrobiae bacterium]|nr:GDP-mannose 4,6-dehydratase [Verrucomicrobiae bacterium]
MAKHVVHDARYGRPAEVAPLVGDVRKAHTKLGWKPRTTFKELVKLMVEADIELLKAHQEGKIKVTS